MEHVKKAQEELDRLSLNFPELVKVCEKYKLPPGLVLGGVVGVFSLATLIF